MTLENSRNRSLLEAMSSPDSSVLKAAAAKEKTNEVDESFLNASLSSVFDEAFDIYKINFLPLFLLISIVCLPVQIILHGIVNTWLVPIMHSSGNSGTPDVENGLILVFGFLFTGVPELAIPGLATLLCMTLISGPICILVSDITQGKQTSLISAVRFCSKHYMNLLMSWSVTSLAFVGIIITCLTVISLLFLLIAVIFQGNLPNAVSVVMLLLMILVPYLLGCAMAAKWYMFTTQLMVLEGQPVSKVPLRNAQLSECVPFRQSWLAAISLPLITYGLFLILIFSIDSITHLLHLTAGAEFVVQTGLASFLFLFFQPYWMIFLTLLYYNYRAKGEGLDIYKLVETLPVNPNRVESTSSNAPAAAKTPPILPDMPVSKIPPVLLTLPTADDKSRVSPFVIPPLPIRNENTSREELP